LPTGFGSMSETVNIKDYLRCGIRDAEDRGKEDAT
jgi:hypothetical protein